METLMKKYQQKYIKARDELDKWDELQSLLLSLFTNASIIIQRLQLIQDPEKFATLKCVEGIEDALLGKQLESLTAIFISMNKTMDDFKLVVRSLEKLSQDGSQLIQGGSNHSNSKHLQLRIGLKPSIVDFVDGLKVLCEMHQAEYRLKSSIVSTLEEVCLKQSGRDCIGGLRRLLVDQPNIPKEEGSVIDTKCWCRLSSGCKMQVNFLTDNTLRARGRISKRLNPECFIQEISQPEIQDPVTQPLSTHAIMKLARERLIEMNSRKTDIFSVLSSTKKTESTLNTSCITNEDVDFALLLQGAAQLVSNEKYLPARKLLDKCEIYGSITGRPTQRVVYYFATALQERIDRQWGFFRRENISLKRKDPIDVMLTKLSLQPSWLECQQDLPTVVISEFTSIQSLFDMVITEERIHIVDLCIKNGSRWIILMEALAARVHTPLKLLKITAIGTSKKMMDETGERLASIARAMNVPFQFNIVVSELKDINENMFELKDDEAVAIFSRVFLWTILPCPLHLHALLQVLKKLKPCVMMVDEFDASMNSPIFLERFMDSLIYFSAVFDAFYVQSENHPFRKLYEEIYLKRMLTSVVVEEGQERIYRQESVKGWRKIFAMFGIVGTDLSDTALYQARYLLENSAYQSYMSLDMDEECMIINWRGTPLHFVSAWKFEQ